ncbi:hypothetical protein R1sor_009295 [Riccia sorocarpa]|uniref:Uncharacterized protein n=1 Tax=Riccia sorocarpa TaxID=122646 RepID=A0ABD3HY29_9MARC
MVLNAGSGLEESLSGDCILLEKRLRLLFTSIVFSISAGEEERRESVSPTTVQCLLRAVGRVIRSRQEQRSVESGAPVHPFNILKDARYHKVKLAADEAVQHAMDRGLGKTVKKSDILTLDEERRMLAQEKCSLQCPRGLNYVMSYYCLRNFFIRGAAELRHVNWEDFSIENLVSGQVLRYTSGTFKNWKIDVARCGADNLRKPVDCQMPQEQDILAMAAIKENSHPNKPEQQISCREAVIEVQETVVMQADKGVHDVALLQTTTTTVAEAAVAGEMKRGRLSEKLEEFGRVE